MDYKEKSWVWEDQQRSERNECLVKTEKKRKRH